MTKLHILAKISYGDFDARIETPLFASSNKDVLKLKAAELNATRTKDEIEDEIKYELMSEIVKLI